jgi:putative aldouronate transport system substrate-binding protein
MKIKAFGVISTVLVIFICLSILAGCVPITPVVDSTGTTEKSPDPTVAEQTDPPAIIKVFLQERWAGIPYDNLATRHVEEKTNTKMIITAAPAREHNNVLNVLLASGERPDLINLPGDDAYVNNLVKEGLLLPLNKYFDKVPNMYEAKKPYWDISTDDDGNIYTINACISAADGGTQYIPMYRKDWLTKLGLEVPTTIDEYMVLADAIVNNDPNGNGEKDTYAFGGRSFQDGRLYQQIFGAYGTLPFNWLDIDGEIIYSSTEPGAKEALRTMNKLYEMGAIDPEFITDNAARVKAKWAEGKYGALCYAIFCFDENNVFNYYGPFKENNPDGEMIEGPVLKGSGYREDVGMFTVSERGSMRTGISAISKEVDACLRVLDWYHTEEGRMFANYGFEGEHFEWDNGVVKVLITEEQQQETGITQLDLATEYLALSYSKPYQRAAEFASKIGTKNPLEGIVIEDANLIISDFREYARTLYVQMIVGEISIDEGFAQVLTEWEKRGGVELAAKYNELYKARKQ